MDWLMHNPIADMYGPSFLLLYAGVIAVTFASCWMLLRNRDWTASLPVAAVPSDPDAYEIAYLRGGENELIRSVIFSLIQRGQLRVNREGKEPLIERASEPADRHSLTPLERRVFEWFSVPHSAQDLFRANGLPSQIKSFSATFEQRLRKENLLMPVEVREAAVRIWIAGALVIGALGGYKFIVAVEKGRYNVAFLVIMGVAALLLLIKVCRLPRLSKRGRAYLTRLQLAFEQLKTRADTSKAPLATSVAAVDPTLLLMVGLFGVGALSGTGYDYYKETFRKASATSGSSGGSGCGSSCGSSCSSSSGGDGGGSCGGGGCGGGGCGGCGG